MLLSKFPMAAGFNPAKHISYTGDWSYEEKTMDGVKYWLLAFKTDGTLTILKEGIKADICLIGAGQGGTAGQTSGTLGGPGGYGGWVMNAYGIILTTVDIKIGKGSPGGNKNSLDPTASVGGTTWYGDLLFAFGGGYKITEDGPEGGSTGGVTGSYATPAKGMNKTTRPFESADMEPASAGGGAGVGVNGEGYYNSAFDNGSDYTVYHPGIGGSDGSDGSKGSVSTGHYEVDVQGAPGGYKGGGKGGGIKSSMYSEEFTEPTAGSTPGDGGGGGWGFVFTNTGPLGGTSGNSSDGAPGADGIIYARVKK